MRTPTPAIAETFCCQP